MNAQTQISKACSRETHTFTRHTEHHFFFLYASTRGAQSKRAFSFFCSSCWSYRREDSSCYKTNRIKKKDCLFNVTTSCYSIRNATQRNYSLSLQSLGNSDIIKQDYLFTMNLSISYVTCKQEVLAKQLHVEPSLQKSLPEAKYIGKDTHSALQ